MPWEMASGAPEKQVPEAYKKPRAAFHTILSLSATLEILLLDELRYSVLQSFSLTIMHNNTGVSHWLTSSSRRSYASLIISTVGADSVAGLQQPSSGAVVFVSSFSLCMVFIFCLLLFRQLKRGIE